MKFKVGDRVRCTRNVDGFNTKGKTGTVKETYTIFCAVDFDENVEGWGDTGLGIKEGHGVSVKYEDLELIEENTFTLGDLKVGYLVELKDGSRNMIMESTTGKVLVDESGVWLNLNNYNNDFKFLDNDNDFDIMKVYGFSPYNNKALKFNTKDRELLWERKEMLDNEEILNDKEKEYLSNFIKPFRNSVESIVKESTDDYEFIVINLNDELNPVSLPLFDQNKYYKNMETYKKYTLEELGL